MRKVLFTLALPLPSLLHKFGEVRAGSNPYPITCAMQSLAQRDTGANIPLRPDREDHYRFAHATDISPSSLGIKEDAIGARCSFGIEKHCLRVLPI
jgi:hypothetical protein